MTWLFNKYLEYREAERDLVRRIVEAHHREGMTVAAGNALGLVKDDTVQCKFRGEWEATLDFMLNDYRTEGKTMVEHYREHAQPGSEIEKEVLEALLSSYTSLFRIEAVDGKRKTISWLDLLNDETRTTVIDPDSLEEIAPLPAEPGLLSFFRLVPFADFSMIIGFPFFFQPGSEQKILEKYRRVKDTLPPADESITRFAAFIRINRSDGTFMLK